MNNNTAFVFDTNFIIQNHDLEAVTKKLIEKGFFVYITQVAVDERIAQECNKQKEKYDEIKAAAVIAGESVNRYIKNAISQRMEREQS